MIRHTVFAIVVAVFVIVLTMIGMAMYACGMR